MPLSWMHLGCIALFIMLAIDMHTGLAGHVDAMVLPN